MATTTTPSKSNAAQKPTESKIVVSPEQEPHRLIEAQDMLKHLRVILTEGETPSVNVLSEALQKAEELILRASQHPDMDSDTSKALEDITALLVSARQLGRNKQIADRLEKISVESEKALKAVRVPGVAAATKAATENIVEFMTNWRPLFYLMTSSRDFRQLLLDANRITRRIVFHYTEDIKEDTKEKFAEGAPAKELIQNVKDKAKDKEVPEMTDEEWNTLQDDIQRVLVLLSHEPSYKEGVQRIFTLLDMFQNTLTQDQIPGKVVPTDIHIKRVVSEAEDLMASFSGRDALEAFKYHLRNLLMDIQKNEKLRSYLIELKEFILKAKSEEEIRSEEFKSKSKELAHRGREGMRELREKEDLKPFFRSINDMMDNIKNDEFLQILRHHAGIVQSDFSYVDTQGKAHVDTDMLSKLQSALLPVLAETLKYIPIPKIQSNDKEREFWLDNVVLCSYDLIPDKIRFHLESDSEVSMRDIEIKSSHTDLVIRLDKLLTELKDMEFYYHKKTFPEIEDHGKVTFRIKGDGARLTFRFTLDHDEKSMLPKLSRGYASFDISDMDIEFNKETLKHEMMIPMLTQMFKVQIRQEIEDQVEKNLTEPVKKLGDVISKSLTEINRPYLSGLEQAKKAVKSSQMGQVYEKRREKLE